MEMYQQTFQLALSTHVAPMVMTIRLRVRFVCSRALLCGLT